MNLHLHLKTTYQGLIIADDKDKQSSLLFEFYAGAIYASSDRFKNHVAPLLVAHGFTYEIEQEQVLVA